MQILTTSYEKALQDHTEVRDTLLFVSEREFLVRKINRDPQDKAVTKKPRHLIN